MQPPNPNRPSQPPPTGGLDQRFASYCGACPKLEKGSPKSQLTGWGWNHTKKLSQSVDFRSPGGGPDLRELLYHPPVSCSQAESPRLLTHRALTSRLTDGFSNCSAQEPGSSSSSRSYTRQGKRAGDCRRARSCGTRWPGWCFEGPEASGPRVPLLEPSLGGGGDQVSQDHWDWKTSWEGQVVLPKFANNNNKKTRCGFPLLFCLGQPGNWL